jgi:zinc transporter ZupT
MKLNIVPLFSVILLGSQIGAAYGVHDSVAKITFQTKDEAMILPSQNHQQDPRRTSEGEHDGDHGDEDHDGDHDKKKPWGKVIGYSLLVNLVTFCGVILLAFPSIRNGLKTQADNPSATDAEKGEIQEGYVVEDSQTAATTEGRWQAKLLDICVPGFAAGALLATITFLIVPEALHILNKAAGKDNEDHRFLRFLEGEEGHGEGHDEHEGELSGDAIWRFGAGLMGGYLLPIVFKIVFPHNDSHSKNTYVEDDATPDQVSQKKKAYHLALSILLGDFCHNFCDGIFIGTAFSLCDNATAMAVVVATIYHEIAQEIGDFFLLTKHAGFSILAALGFNFLSGLSVLFGAIVVVAADVSDLGIGSLLSVSAGVYLYIGTSECIPRANAAVREDVLDGLLIILAFFVGAIPTGLVLLNHQHCDAGHE